MEGDKEVETLPVRGSQTNPLVSFVKKVGFRTLAWVGVYLLGYFDFSVAWMITPLLLSVARDQWKKEKRNRLTAAREAALTNEQAMLETRMNAEDLPSWVFFPDKERAEWVNSILKQLWPYVNEYVRDTLFNTVEPAVETALRQYKLNGFRFERERVFLGQVPPRITGIKVYDTNTSRREIILDVDLVFASDMEIVFKVKGISARVSDFGLRGMARVVLKPLISEIPLVGGVQVYFLKAPEIDYSLGGVAGALEIPGLNRIVDKIIAEQVKNFIVLPNKFSMPLVNTIPGKVLKCPDSAGVLRVQLIKARGLKDTDGLGSGKSDPYCILTVGAHTSRAPTVLDNLSPEWNQCFDFPIEIVQGQELLLELYDEDSRKGDTFLGRAKVQSSLVADRGHIDSYWVDLMDTESNQDDQKEETSNLGQVQVSLSWLPVTSDSTVVKAAAKSVKPGEESAACLVHLYIDSCSGLVNPRDPAYKPSPKVEIINSTRTVQRSWPKYYTNDPVIEQGFVALIHNPYTDEIRLNVVDSASKKDEIIGTTSIRIWSLIEQPGMEYQLQPFLLKGNSPDSKILLSASLRGLMPATTTSPKKSPSGTPARDEVLPSPASPGLTEDALDSTVVGGKIRLKLHQAADLEKKDLSGKADPYVVVKYEDQVHKTPVVKKSLDPVWDTEIWLEVAENGDRQVVLEVWDKDRMGKDEVMGRTTIDVRRVTKQGQLSQVWDRLLGCKSGRLLWSSEFFPAQGDPDLNLNPCKEDVGQQPDLVAANMVQMPDRTNFVKPEDLTPTVQLSSPEPELLALSPEPEESVALIPNPHPSAPEPAGPAVSLYTEEETAKLPAEPEVSPQPHVSPRPYVPPQPVITTDLGYLEGKVTDGFLRVTVHRAEELVDKDKMGKSDPYVVIRYAGQKNKSKHIESCLNPEFEFSTGYVTEEGGDPLVLLEVKDHDTIGRNESLGTASLDLRQALRDDGLDKVWVPLQGVPRGRVLVSLQFEGQGGQEEQVVGLEEEVLVRRRVNKGPRVRLNLLYDETTEELKLFLHEAANLPGEDLPDPPDPQVKICLLPGKKKKKKSEVVKDSGNPKYDEEFDFSIEYDDLPKYTLKITVVDKKGLFSKSPSLGSLEIPLDNPGLRQGLADWFPLEEAEEDSD